MSRFLSRAGSSIEALQRQLARRTTVDDSTNTPLLHTDASNENEPSGASPPSSSLFSSLGGFSRLPTIRSDFRFPTSSSFQTSPISSPTSSKRTRFRHVPTLSPIPAGITTTSPEPTPTPTPATNNYGSIFPSWIAGKNPPTAGKQYLFSPASSSPKLDTFEGVFVPTVLSIWGIILFLRFGFIISQAGVLLTLSMFVLGYVVNLLTTLSLSAISTNGTVRGGGPYYLISRSLGPEFGGSIGLVYYIGNLMNGSMSVLGFVEPLLENFGSANGELLRLLPEGPWWGFTYGMVILMVCTGISLMGSKPYARTSIFLAGILLVSTITIFISFLFKYPFEIPEKHIDYTAFRFRTLRDNFLPRFTVAPVAGKEDRSSETIQSVFSVLFPACNGILAGAQLSGDLRDPSKSIPKGTLYAVGLTFTAYSLIVILMGGTITRESMYNDLNILQDVSIFPLLFAAGSLAASIYAVLGAVIGSAKILQAIARDNLLPILSPFAQGTPEGDEPIYGVLFTFVVTVAFCFIPSINSIAAFVTMAMLLTFGILNLACFLLKISSAPNFRPSFQFFKWWTAASGFIVCIGTMIAADQVYALVAMGFMLLLFVWIHYQSPPKSWGDVTQSLIYHQVRKYLLRLDSRKEHVKFWRPQILLLVNNPRTNYRIIQFCNSLKKGALYILGHVIEGEFRELLPEFKRQQNAWLRFVDESKIKAFIQITIADNERLGARNLFLGSGLGGMRPNIIVLGSFDMEGHRHALETKTDNAANDNGSSATLASPTILRSNEAKIDFMEPLSTDVCRVEASIKATDYVGIIEDVLSLNKAVAIGFGFRRLEQQLKSNKGWFNPRAWFPDSNVPAKKKYIDLWPMQVSVDTSDPANAANLGMTNFEPYTMVLQMGTILHMVPYWKEHYVLRVICFVEHREDVEEHRQGVAQLLESLRIGAELLVLWLDGGEVKSYDAIVRQEAGVDERVDRLLAGTDWWKQEVERRQLKSDSYGDGHRTPQGGVPVRRSQITGLSNNASSTSALRMPRYRRERSGSLPTTLGMRINMPVPVPDDIDLSSDDDTEENRLFGRSLSSSYGDRRRQAWASGPQRLSWAGNEVHSNGYDENEDHHSDAMVHEPESHVFLADEAADPQPSHAASGASSTSSSTLGSPSIPLASNTTVSSRPLVFDELPSRAQNLILNDLMRRHSSAENTAIVFSTLPAPVNGTSADKEAAFSYLENLETLVEGLPPVLLIHAKSMTVTMTL